MALPLGMPSLLSRKPEIHAFCTSASSVRQSACAFGGQPTTSNYHLRSPCHDCDVLLYFHSKSFARTAYQRNQVMVIGSDSRLTAFSCMLEPPSWRTIRYGFLTNVDVCLYDDKFVWNGVTFRCTDYRSRDVETHRHLYHDDSNTLRGEAIKLLCWFSWR